MEKKTVLVIDDDLDMDEIYKKMLSKKYNVLISVDAIDARKKLAKYKVDLIILDLMLPNESGKDFLLALKKDPKYSHVKILIASVFLGLLEEVKKIYPDITSMPKPFSQDDFLGEVEKKLGGDA